MFRVLLTFVFLEAIFEVSRGGPTYHVRHERTRLMGSRNLHFGNSYYQRTFGHHRIGETPRTVFNFDNSHTTPHDFLKKSYKRPLFSWDPPNQSNAFNNEILKRPYENIYRQSTHTPPVDPSESIRTNKIIRTYNPVSFRLSYVRNGAAAATVQTIPVIPASKPKKRRKKIRCKGLSKKECKKLRKGLLKKQQESDQIEYQHNLTFSEICKDSKCEHFCSLNDGRAQCSCRDGFYLVNGFQCEDLNECATNNGDCEWQCINILGSKVCTCPSGFQVTETGKCLDVNECAENNGGCSQDCLNLNGGNKCLCRNGFILNEDGHTCDDVDECLTSNGGCEEICNNTVGSWECACNPGYKLIHDNRTCLNVDCESGYYFDELALACVDVDECLLANGGCQQICENTIGSRICKCPEGYQITSEDGVSCIDVNECQEHNGQCEETCVNSAGSYSCQCKEGFQLADDHKTCVDVDECIKDGGGCEGNCTNTAGSYKCECPDGFKLAEDGKSCVDDNECAAGNGGCEEICVNTEGSYVCQCEEGFQLAVDKRTCVDINECLIDNGGCDNDECVNTVGSWECRCKDGFKPSEDEESCTDIDECYEQNGNCSQECVNTPGSYHCACRIGYQLEFDQVTCVDINECSNGNGGCVGTCMNTDGSRLCSCPIGYQLGEDLRSCIDLNECLTNNGGCSDECINIEGSWKCHCPSGYRLLNDSLSCGDVDECAAETSDCKEVCVNTEGSYKCECLTGFQLSSDGKSCEDLDECKLGLITCAEDEICQNRLGAVECAKCSDGFVGKDGLCVDRNECEENDRLGPCQYGCNNTDGSYICYCDEANGFSLSPDKHNCIESKVEIPSSSSAPNDCETGEAKCSHKCENIQGHVYCTCPVGWELGDDWKTCQDINECENPEEYQVTCPDSCVNTEGSYFCKKLKEKLICPEDIVAEVGPNENVAEITLEKPETNLDWHSEISAEPNWGKNETVFLTANTYEIKYFSSKDSSLHCTFVIEVLEGQPPQKVTCPDSKIVQLPSEESSVRVFWDEPQFDDNVEVTDVISNFQRGSEFSLGNHTITYTATDDVGFEVECSFNIYVLPSADLTA